MDIFELMMLQTKIELNNMRFILCFVIKYVHTVDLSIKKLGSRTFFTSIQYKIGISVHVSVY